jgi:hypothetical protein
LFDGLIVGCLNLETLIIIEDAEFDGLIVRWFDCWLLNLETLIIIEDAEFDGLIVRWFDCSMV